MNIDLIKKFMKEDKVIEGILQLPENRHFVLKNCCEVVRFSKCLTEYRGKPSIFFKLKLRHVLSLPSSCFEHPHAIFDVDKALYAEYESLWEEAGMTDDDVFDTNEKADGLGRRRKKSPRIAQEEQKWVTCSKLIPGTTIKKEYEGTTKDIFRNGYDAITLKSGIVIPAAGETEQQAYERCKRFILPGATESKVIPKVPSIGRKAFAGCDDLTTVTIPNGETSIEHWAFAGCDSLTTVVIPDSVTSIGYRAFSWCDGLTVVIIPNSVKSIGDRAFCSCGCLSTVAIPNSVIDIGKEAFAHCGRLTAVTIPDSVTSIGESAFTRCVSLTAITIGNGVISIGEEAFSYCRNLTAVTNLNPTPQDAKHYYGAFRGVDLSNATLYVPAESVEAYKAADVWKDFGKIVHIQR
jgi:hypothetical protein